MLGEEAKFYSLLPADTFSLLREEKLALFLDIDNTILHAIVTYDIPYTLFTNSATKDMFVFQMEAPKQEQESLRLNHVRPGWSGHASPQQPSPLSASVKVMSGVRGEALPCALDHSCDSVRDSPPLGMCASVSEAEGSGSESSSSSGDSETPLAAVAMSGSVGVGGKGVFASGSASRSGSLDFASSSDTSSNTSNGSTRRWLNELSGAGNEARSRTPSVDVLDEAETKDFDGKPLYCLVKPRPGILSFLRSARHFFRIYICTFGSLEYATEIRNRLNSLVARGDKDPLPPAIEPQIISRESLRRVFVAAEASPEFTRAKHDQHSSSENSTDEGEISSQSSGKDSSSTASSSEASTPSPHATHPHQAVTDNVAAAEDMSTTRSSSPHQDTLRRHLLHQSSSNIQKNRPHNPQVIVVEEGGSGSSITSTNKRGTILQAVPEETSPLSSSSSTPRVDVTLVSDESDAKEVTSHAGEDSEVKPSAAPTATHSVLSDPASLQLLEEHHHHHLDHHHHHHQHHHGHHERHFSEASDSSILSAHEKLMSEYSKLTQTLQKSLRMILGSLNADIDERMCVCLDDRLDVWAPEDVDNHVLKIHPYSFFFSHPIYELQAAEHGLHRQQLVAAPPKLNLVLSSLNDQALKASWLTLSNIHRKFFYRLNLLKSPSLTSPLSSSTALSAISPPPSYDGSRDVPEAESATPATHANAVSAGVGAVGGNLHWTSTSTSASSSTSLTVPGGLTPSNTRAISENGRVPRREQARFDVLPPELLPSTNAFLLAHRLPVLKGVIIAHQGRLVRDILKLATYFGAEVLEEMGASVTHFLVSSTDPETCQNIRKRMKNDKAFAAQVTVVTCSWITDCARDGRKISETPYLLTARIK